MRCGTAGPGRVVAFYRVAAGIRPAARLADPADPNPAARDALAAAALRAAYQTVLGLPGPAAFVRLWRHELVVLAS